MSSLLLNEHHEQHDLYMQIRKELYDLMYQQIISKYKEQESNILKHPTMTPEQKEKGLKAIYYRQKKIKSWEQKEKEIEHEVESFDYNVILSTDSFIPLRPSPTVFSDLDVFEHICSNMSMISPNNVATQCISPSNTGLNRATESRISPIFDGPNNAVMQRISPSVTGLNRATESRISPIGDRPNNVAAQRISPVNMSLSYSHFEQEGDDYVDLSTLSIK
jgi:phage pi2 protein 07